MSFFSKNNDSNQFCNFSSPLATDKQFNSRCRYFKQFCLEEGFCEEFLYKTTPLRNSFCMNPPLFTFNREMAVIFQDPTLLIP